MQAQINGFIPPDFIGSLPAVDVRRAPQPKPSQFPPVEIGNGRDLQAGASSEAQFFADTGFVLLKHKASVEDWDDVPPLFAEEIEEIIRTRLFPGTRIEIQQSPSPMRRGRGTENPQYGQGVHSDGPLTAELYATNVGAFAGAEVERWWTERYLNDDVAGFVSIDFWRTTNMAGPLRHMPLAVCAPASLERPDILAMDFIGIAPDERTTHHLGLRYNPSQRWYFYPDMTGDEVLAFKLCEFWKDDPDASPQNCFHSAFVDPATPADAEERQSCEHRVGVLILRD